MSQSPLFQDRPSGRTYRDAPEMVNDYLRRFGDQVGIAIAPLDRDGYTEVQRGSATVGINVLVEHGTLLLLSRIMTCPERAARNFIAASWSSTSS